jgi:hypothetical protein
VIPTLLVVALACLALVYVAAPLRDRDESAHEGSVDTAELLGKKRAALTAILDMEEERDAGKLSTGDFAVLRREYEAEAAEALAELDALRSPDAPADADLEAEIAAIRDRIRGEGGGEGGPTEPCPSCGTPRAPGRACDQCGA